ncbi:MAG: hypothetical protein JWR10_2456 [Rubritepida sp.]|nr:hypothetical protein [Rubritepida sp.]
MSMQRFARITTDGFAAEIIEIEEGGAPISERFNPSIASTFVEVPAEVVTGWSLSGSTWSAPEPPAHGDVATQPLTARQLRLWLLSRGITGAMVETALAQVPEGQRERAQIEWEYATEYLRSHPLIDQVGAAFDLAAPDIDEAWPEAAAL